MNTLGRGFVGAIQDVRSRWVELFVGAMIIALFLGLALRFMFPTPTVWEEWHSVEAEYDKIQHAVVITSRSWTIYDPCPEGAAMMREARVLDTKRQPYVFQTQVARTPQNTIGAHSAGPLVIPLRDVHGERLNIEPYSVQLIDTCGSVRTPVISREVVLAPEGGWWP